MHDYRERLYVPLAWWLLAVPTVLILGATLYAGLAEPWPIVIMTGLAAACATFLIAASLATLEIRDGALRTGKAALPLATSARSSPSTKSRPRGCAARARTRRPTFTRDPT